MAEGKIFISYRRADASGYAGRLYDHLSDRFGADEVPKHGTNGLYRHLITQNWNWVDLVTRCRLNGH